jgi:hypothetical protein
MRYKVIESRRWVNKVTDERASVYGAVPWINQNDKTNWQIMTVGYTVLDTVSNTVGMGKPPFTTIAAAQAFATKLENL